LASYFYHRIIIFKGCYFDKDKSGYLLICNNAFKIKKMGLEDKLKQVGKGISEVTWKGLGYRNLGQD